MKKYKVVDLRIQFRNDPACLITEDNEEKFVVRKQEKDEHGNTVQRFIILNPRGFQEERFVDEQEAIILKLKGIKIEEIKDDAV